mgnify:CR=1 FL=1
MAVKISDLPIITTATDDDYLPMVDPSSGQTRRILKSDLLKELRAGTDLAAQAVKANKADFSVADQTARDALTPFEGLMVYRKDLDVLELYNGSSWLRLDGFYEIGRQTLNPSASTMSVASMLTMKYLKIIVMARPSGGTIAPAIRLNNDSGANYAINYSTGGAAYVAATSGNQFLITPATEAYPLFSITDIVNFSTEFKVGHGNSTDAFGTNATTTSNFSEYRFKYASATQANRVDIINNGGTGTFAAGSELIILGKN